MLSAKDIDTLRSIARAHGDYLKIKQVLGTVVWHITEDAPDLGYMRVDIPTDKVGEFYNLIVVCHDDERHPHLLLTFVCFPDSEGYIADFNAKFQAAANAIEQGLGKPNIIGQHQLSFRAWPYTYHRWSLPEGEFTLVQDEFDIQNGMDITLWIQPVGTPLEKTLHL